MVSPGSKLGLLASTVAARKPRQSAPNDSRKAMMEIRANKGGITVESDQPSMPRHRCPHQERIATTAQLPLALRSSTTPREPCARFEHDQSIPILPKHDCTCTIAAARRDLIRRGVGASHLLVLTVTVSSSICQPAEMTSKERGSARKTQSSEMPAATKVKGRQRDDLAMKANDDKGERFVAHDENSPSGLGE